MMKLPMRPAARPSGTRGGDEIGKGQPVAAALAGPERHCDQYAEKAAVETHAAFPDGKDFQRMGKIVGRFVKQHLPETAAENHAKYAVKQQIVELFRADRGQVLANTEPAEGDELAESDQVHQAIPMHGEWAEGKSNRVELRVEQHGRRALG